MPLRALDRPARPQGATGPVSPPVVPADPFCAFPAGGLRAQSTRHQPLGPTRIERFCPEFDCSRRKSDPRFLQRGLPTRSIGTAGNAGAFHPPARATTQSESNRPWTRWRPCLQIGRDFAVPDSWAPANSRFPTKSSSGPAGSCSGAPPTAPLAQFLGPTGPEQRAILLVSGTRSPQIQPGSVLEIVNAFVPVGAHVVTVSDPTGLSVGDRVRGRRTATDCDSGTRERTCFVVLRRCPAVESCQPPGREGPPHRGHRRSSVLSGCSHGLRHRTTLRRRHPRP